jgi:tetraacyldisaccharide 4'-kinase
VSWLKQIILWQFSLVYALAILLWSLYWRIAGKVKLNCKVISVGNIAVGGTGKTPVVIYLAKLAVESGHKTAVIARGYKRKAKGLIEVTDNSTWKEVGDEPLEVFELTENVRVYVDQSKTRAAQQAARDGAGVIIIDDGFQHRRLHRDYDIVCLDWSAPFGNGHLLPLGLLREPPGHIKRADCIMFTAYDNHITNNIDLKSLPRNQYYATINIQSYINLKNDETKSPEQLQGIKAVAFAGLGNPGKFEKSLREVGIDVVKFIAFPDHHHYCQADINRLVKLANEQSAACLITTFKDAVKIDSYSFGGFDIYSAIPGLSITDSAGANRNNDLKAWLGL